MAPLPWSHSILPACFIPRNTARDRMAMVRSYASTVVSLIEPTAPTIPALLTMPSRRPNCATARFTASSMSASWSHRCG